MGRWRDSHLIMPQFCPTDGVHLTSLHGSRSPPTLTGDSAVGLRRYGVSWMIRPWGHLSAHSLLRRHVGDRSNHHALGGEAGPTQSSSQVWEHEISMPLFSRRTFSPPAAIRLLAHGLHHLLRFHRVGSSDGAMGFTWLFTRDVMEGHQAKENQVTMRAIPRMKGQ